MAPPFAIHRGMEIEVCLSLTLDAINSYLFME